MAPGWGDRDRSPNSRSSALSAPARCRRALDPRGSSQATRTSDDVRERAIVPNCGYFCSPEGKAHLRIKAAGRTASETGAVEGTERKSRKPGKAEPWERSKKSGPSCWQECWRTKVPRVPRPTRLQDRCQEGIQVGQPRGHQVDVLDEQPPAEGEASRSKTFETKKQ